jgi:hypothetical protein
MALHFDKIKHYSSQSLHSLKQVQADSDEIFDLREGYPVGKSAMLVRRVYVNVSDSDDLKLVGWVLNASVTGCMMCLKEFGMFSTRHHCRACGDIVCSDCANKSAILVGFNSLGAQRICKSCFKFAYQEGRKNMVQLQRCPTYGISLVPEEAPPAYNDEKGEGEAFLVSSPSGSTTAGGSISWEKGAVVQQDGGWGVFVDQDSAVAASASSRSGTGTPSGSQSHGHGNSLSLPVSPPARSPDTSAPSASASGKHFTLNNLGLGLGLGLGGLGLGGARGGSQHNSANDLGASTPLQTQRTQDMLLQQRLLEERLRRQLLLQQEEDDDAKKEEEEQGGGGEGGRGGSQEEKAAAAGSELDVCVCADICAALSPEVEASRGSGSKKEEEAGKCVAPVVAGYSGGSLVRDITQDIVEAEAEAEVGPESQCGSNAAAEVAVTADETAHAASAADGNTEGDTKAQYTAFPAEGSQRSQHSQKAEAEFLEVVPFPGFVIKSRRQTNDGSKIFINVLHHPQVKDDARWFTAGFCLPTQDRQEEEEVGAIGGGGSFGAADARTGASAGAGAGAGTTAASYSSSSSPSLQTAAGRKEVPVIYFGQSSSTEDKEGQVSLLYNVLVSSAYFEEGALVPLTPSSSVKCAPSLSPSPSPSPSSSTKDNGAVTGAQQGAGSVSSKGSAKVSSTPLRSGSIRELTKQETPQQQQQQVIAPITHASAISKVGNRSHVLCVCFVFC